MMVKANEDKQQFERGLQQFNALRNVFAPRSARCASGSACSRCATRCDRPAGDGKKPLQRGLREAMERFFRHVDGNLSTSAEAIQEIRAMMTRCTRSSATSMGWRQSIHPTQPAQIPKEMARLERIFNERFNTMFKMLTLGQHQLTARFFETLASKVVQVFELANSETEVWLKALIAPMETQVREHKIQLKRRLESVSRIHAATETLDERIANSKRRSGP